MDCEPGLEHQGLPLLVGVDDDHTAVLVAHLGSFNVLLPHVVQLIEM